MRKILGIIFIMCFFVILVATGCDMGKSFKRNKQGDNGSQPASSIAIGENEAKALTDKVPIHLYFAISNPSKLKLEVREIPISEAKKSANHLATIVIKELIKGPEEKSMLKRTIPEGVTLHSDVVINDGIATVDLDKSFLTKKLDSDISEQLTIYSIVNSLTELKEVQKVKFLIDGSLKHEYKGTMKFDELFPRCTSVISRAVDEANTSTAGGTKGNASSCESENKAKDVSSQQDISDDILE